MKSLFHITEDISRASGGVRTVVKDLKNQFPLSTLLSTVKDKDDVDIIEFKKSGPWLYSPQLKEYLNQIPQKPIFHLHGVWMHAQYIAAKIAAKRKVPFIVSPHGMYEPWLWKEGALKKKLYFYLLSKSAFAKARYIHAITPDEQKNLQKLFSKTEVVCIPNAIEIEDLIERDKPHKPYILFLGRIHPKKGIKLLIEVFNSLKALDFDLKIAGPENDHIQELKLLAKGNERISFLGAVRGKEKKRLYRNAHVFIAPSYSEVVGMVNLEAAMMATPVITTYQTGLLKEWGQNGGILIDPNQKELKNAIQVVSKWTSKERDAAGKKLREFVINEYSWKVNKPKWEQLYNSMS
ncbi:glycosyltransferase involved in cell wall biosynthesis [Nonlabens dokdonensis]|uniref:Glycosyltransferase involved in cell wall biosynthesis n=2 Tax=Nonlabens dokdonensis TaxID=328515 RepID=A0ABX5Q2G8_9FLAO|nr:glycosyltransferase [Nonlabens dokdonensis]AGC76577.1 putative poly(glycerol-phosphate) alpha-glucosyltransferase [Nonlabens dokdonensis DSW-6]PZX44228.1 glycosyltransferase involved in cell wall biosynthesis [Nonlabens dokdonensis]